MNIDETPSDPTNKEKNTVQKYNTVKQWTSFKQTLII